LQEDIKNSKNIKNKILVCTLADAKNKLPFADFHIVQNPILEDKTSFYVTHFPQPGIIKRDKNTIDTVGFKGEIQNLDDMFKTQKFIEDLKEINMKFKKDIDKNLWRDYSNIDITLAIRRKRKNKWFNKPITKLLNGWIANTPVIVSKYEIGYQMVKKSPLDFIEVEDYSQTLKAINKLKDKALFEDMVENGKLRAKEFSLENIVKRWIEILEEIKTKKTPLKTKLLKKIYLKGY
jgi:glycosyltransferase involved in cell wall biosynthesis